MTKREAEAEFKSEILPEIQRIEREQGRQGKDGPMRAEGWNNFTDSLCKDSRITLKQYESWGHPSCC